MSGDHPNHQLGADHSQVGIIGDHTHVEGSIHFHGSGRDSLLETREGVDFVIITALEEERDAVLDKLPGYQREKPTEEDIRVYYSAQLPVTYPGGTKGVYDIVLVPLLGMGRTQAATATTDAIRRWHPRYVLLVGIAGGVAESDVALGDVLVSDQIVDYELQRISGDDLEIRWKAFPAHPRMMGAARNFQDETWQRLLNEERPEAGVPVRHIGPIASGDKVIASSQFLDRFRNTWSRLIGVEMEAAGVAIAAHQATLQPGLLMVRGVSDLADEQKRSPDVEAWRSYACDVAASYAIGLLKSGPVPPASNALEGESLPHNQAVEHVGGPYPRATPGRESATETEQTDRARWLDSAGAELVPVPRDFTPLVRTISRLEENLSQYETASQKRMRDTIDQAVETIRHRKPGQARRLLSTVLSEMAALPGTVEMVGLKANVHRLLGLCHLRLGNHDVALEGLKQARSIGGETEDLTVALLEYHMVQGNRSAAAEMARELLDDKPKAVEAKNVLAIIELDDGNLGQTVDLLEGDPHAREDVNSQGILATAYGRLGELSLSLERAERAVEIDPQSPQAHATLGNAQLALAYAPLRGQVELPVEWVQEILEQDELRAAIESYETALGLCSGQEVLAHPLVESVRTNLANALASNGDLARAIALLDDNLREIPTPSAENFLLRAQFEDQSGDPDTAVETCMRGLEAFPGDCRLLTTLGGLALNEGDPEVAREWLAEAIKSCSNPSQLAFIGTIRSKTHLFEDDRAGSLASLRSIPEDEQETVSVLLAYGDHHTHFKNYPEAEAHYQQAFCKAPSNIAVLHRLVSFYRQLKQVEKTLRYAETLVGLVDTPRARLSYLELLLEADQGRAALSLVEQLKEDGFDEPIIKRLEAGARQACGELAHAARLYEEYLKDSPGEFGAVFSLGLCYGRIPGKRQRAIHFLSSAEAIRPEEVEVHVALAQTYQIEGQYEESFEHAQKALSLASDDPDIYLFFFLTAHSCGFKEEAAKVLSEIPKRFPQYERLRISSLDEAKQLMASSRKRVDQILDLYRSGKIPLLLVADVLGRPLIDAWRLLAQDDRLRINCSVGSVGEQENSYARASSSDEVVIDYSALVTLSHLELLDLPVELFGTVHVAQGLVDQIQADKLYLRQRIDPERVERSRTLLDTIHQDPKFRPQNQWARDSLILDAQQVEDMTPHHEQDVLLAKQTDSLYLLDSQIVLDTVKQVLPDQVVSIEPLLDYLKRNGKITVGDYEEACDYLRRTDRLHDVCPPEIERFGSLVVSHISLQALSEIDALVPVIDEFDRIYVAYPTVLLLSQAIDESKYLEDLLGALGEIESALANKDGYHVSSSPAFDKAEPESDEGLDRSLVGPFALAEELGAPIWTDDLASRRLAAGYKPTRIHTFDTRILLDAAMDQGLVRVEDGFSAILALLKWGYHFVHINASILYWSIEQHSMVPNDDTDLLLASLDQSVAHGYRRSIGTQRRFLNGEAEVEELERRLELFVRNLRVYAELILYVWHSVPAEDKGGRSRWIDVILSRALESTDYWDVVVVHLMALCLTRMLRDFDDERLDHFLALCGSPFGPFQSYGPSIADEAVFVVLANLYTGGNYNKLDLEVASRLVSNLRMGQYFRVRATLKAKAEGFLDTIESC